MGLLLKGHTAAVPDVDAITWAGFLGNLAPVILGNLVGGSFFVAFVYYATSSTAAERRHRRCSVQKDEANTEANL